VILRNEVTTTTKKHPDVPVVGDRGTVTTMPNYLSEKEGDIVGRLEGGEKGNGAEVLLDVPG
jgi:hypothetical protein